MRSLFLLAGLLSVRAEFKVNCVLNGARAVDDMMDSAVYIMASVVRCDKSNGEDADDVRCALDVSSAIEAVNAMVNVILKAMDHCGSLNVEHKECALAVSRLTESWAGLAAASSCMVAKCPNEFNHGVPLDTVGQSMTNAGASIGQTNNRQHGNQFAAIPGNHQFTNLQGGASFGQCIVNIKGTMKSLFKAVKRILSVVEYCEGSAKECAENDLKVMAALIGMGEYLSGAIGKCTPITAAGSLKTKRSAICSQYSLKLIEELGVAGRASTKMTEDCALTPSQRLYLDRPKLDDDIDMQSTSGSSISLVLVALLPISAVLAFIAGSRYAWSYGNNGYMPQPDCEALYPVPEE